MTSQVWASIPVVVEKKNIVQVMGYATAGLSVSQMAGVPIGGYLAGISWRSPFFTISAASLVLLLLINFYMPKLEIGKGHKISFTSAYKNILTNKKFCILSFSLFCLSDRVIYSNHVYCDLV